MKTISFKYFKTKILEFLYEVENSNEELIVTRNDIPILKISSIERKRNVDDVFADLRPTVKMDNSILQPETTKWGMSD